MNTQIIHEKQSMEYLQWSQIRSSSGTAGSFLKATDDLQKPKKYYKLSQYDTVNGIIGHECVNELIADRLLNILGVEHLHYDLIHAEITVSSAEEHRNELLGGLEGIVPQYLLDKIWDMIWERWLYYEDFCNQK